MHDYVFNPAPPPPPSLETIEAFLARTCTADEERAVRQWAGPASRGDLADAVRAIVRAEPYGGTDPYDIVRALRIRLSLSNDVSLCTSSNARQRGRGRQVVPGILSTTARIGWSAGTVALILLAAFTPRWWAGLAHRESAVVPSTREYVTHRAQRTTINFPNGTQVTLAPETRVRYTVNTRGVQMVDVDGDAWFSVVHDARRPLFVRAGTATTQVLGTQFEVRRYPGERIVHVTVVSGKVAVVGTDARARMTVSAGMVALVHDSTVTRMAVDSVRPYTSWTPTELIFRSVPAPEVLATLTRWYGYRFQLADSALAGESLTMVLDARSSSNALRTIELLLNVDLTFDGDLVTLHAHRSSQGHKATSPTLLTPHFEVGR